MNGTLADVGGVRWVRLGLSVAGIAAITLAYARIVAVNPTTVAMSYLVVILLIATYWGIADATAASVLATVGFNFFFLPPVGQLLASAMVASKVAARQITNAEYARAFDEAAYLQGKSLVILMVPMFALGAWALYGRTRRFYAEHLVFAFYVFAFMMIWMGTSTLALTEPVLLGLRHGWSDAVVEMTASTIITLPFMISLFAAARRTYAESRGRTAFKTLLLAGWAIAVVTVYRFVLFFTTFYAT